MFGDIVYQGTGEDYVELLLAEEQSVQVKLCVLNGTIKLYRLEWREEDDDKAHLAVYTLLDAIEQFREKAGLTRPAISLSIPWSDDCMSCLCNLPHTFEEHQRVVAQAREELQAQLQWLEHDIPAEGEQEEEMSGTAE